MDNNHLSVWGRTLEEYKKMFSLENISPSTKLLSIADGPSTFNLELRRLEINITSVDPIYNLSIDELKETFKKSYTHNKQYFYEYPKRFNLRNTEEIEEILAKRQNTFNEFIIDYENNRSNYKFGELPILEFSQDVFDICLCSNFLFLFDHLFELEFHLNSVIEMLRVSNEVRIFPLYNNTDGRESMHLKSVIQYLQDNNYSYSIETNDYHIWKGGNRFLKIIKRNISNETI
jgi:hypothetical protein